MEGGSESVGIETGSGAACQGSLRVWVVILHRCARAVVWTLASGLCRGFIPLCFAFFICLFVDVWLCLLVGLFLCLCR